MNRSKKIAKGNQKNTKSSDSGGRNQSKVAADSRCQQYSMGTDNPGSKVHYYKFTGRQTKTWKPMGKQLKDYLYHLVDSGVRMVGSKPQFSNNADVQKLLDELRLQLKAKMHTIRVPNKRHGDYSKIKARTEELKEELESLTQQQLQLEKSIREEERAIEAMEELQNTSHSTKILFKVPEQTLGLPKMVF